MALTKRPVGEREIDDLVQRIEAEMMQLGLPEVPSSAIGEEVLKQLKALDQVAYIRFASVYREFADLDDLQREIDDLGTDRRSGWCSNNRNARTRQALAFRAFGWRLDLGFDGRKPVEARLDGGLGMRADDLVDRLAFLEDDEHRDGHHTEFERVFLIVVNIDLDDLQIAFALTGNFRENRADRLAGTTPRSPEIDQNGLVSLG